MKKAIAMALSVCMTMGLLAGCGNSETTASAETQPAESTEQSADTTEQTAETETKEVVEQESSDEPITLRFSWWGGDERLEATLAVIEQFEALHPNITIEAEYGSSDGYSDKLATQLAGGTAADIIQIDPGLMPALVSDETNYFIDYNEYGFDFSNFEENYIHQRINGYYDGKQLGIPTGISGAAVLVNQDLADAIGIDFSQQYTWDDLFEWGKKVREYDDSMYLICANKDYVANLYANCYAKQMTGQTFIDEETKEISVKESRGQPKSGALI